MFLNVILWNQMFFGDSEAILIHIHNICFYGKILKIIHFIILIPTTDFPYFYNTLGGNLGSLLYGDDFVMITLYFDFYFVLSVLWVECILDC